MSSRKAPKTRASAKHKPATKSAKKPVTASRRSAFAGDGAEGKAFEPGPGRVMKEWAVIADERSWSALARAAYAFVKSASS